MRSPEDQTGTLRGFPGPPATDCARQADARAGGFTAIEALVVLMLLALAISVGAIAFRRHIMHARIREATSMLADLASKQEAYRAGGGHYLPLRGDRRTDMPSGDEAPGAFYPLPADSPALASARTPVRIDDPSLWPPAWRTLGVRPQKDLLYCTYLVNAGERGRPDPALRFGATLLPVATEGPWYYALAVCNLDGPPGYPDQVTVYGVSSQNGNVRVFNDGH